MSTYSPCFCINAEGSYKVHQLTVHSACSPSVPFLQTPVRKVCSVKSSQQTQAIPPWSHTELLVLFLHLPQGIYTWEECSKI